MAVEQRNYTDGEQIESETEETVAVENPTTSDEIVARYQQLSAADAERAIEAAFSHFDGSVSAFEADSNDKIQIHGIR